MFYLRIKKAIKVALYVLQLNTLFKMILHMISVSKEVQLRYSMMFLWFNSRTNDTEESLLTSYRRFPNNLRMHR